MYHFFQEFILTKNDSFSWILWLQLEHCKVLICYTIFLLIILVNCSESCSNDNKTTILRISIEFGLYQKNSIGQYFDYILKRCCCNLKIIINRCNSQMKINHKSFKRSELQILVIIKYQTNLNLEDFLSIQHDKEFVNLITKFLLF